MRNIFIYLFFIILAFSVAGCSSNSNYSTTEITNVGDSNKASIESNDDVEVSSSQGSENELANGNAVGLPGSNVSNASNNNDDADNLTELEKATAELNKAKEELKLARIELDKAKKVLEEAKNITAKTKVVECKNNYKPSIDIDRILNDISGVSSFEKELIRDERKRIEFHDKNYELCLKSLENNN